MCSCLVHLKQYFYIMELEGSCNLSEVRWKVVEDTCKVLEPFTNAHKLLEGENYTPVSFIPFLISSIGRGLQAELADANSSDQVVALVTKNSGCF